MQNIMKNKLIVLLCAGMLSTFSYGIVPQNNMIPDEPDGSSKQDLHKRKKTPSRSRLDLSASYDREKKEIIIQAGAPLYNCSVDIYDEDETLCLHGSVPAISDQPVRINAEFLSSGQYLLEIRTGGTYYIVLLDIEMD